MLLNITTVSETQCTSQKSFLEELFSIVGRCNVNTDLFIVHQFDLGMFAIGCVARRAKSKRFACKLVTCVSARD